jgi:hypothetical protein
MWTCDGTEMPTWTRLCTALSCFHKKFLCLPLEVFFRCPKVTFYGKDLVIRATPSDGVNFIPYMKLLGVE